jgi:hypothetical protein
MYTEKQEKGAIRGGRSVRMTIDNGKEDPQGARGVVNGLKGARELGWSEVEILAGVSFRRRGQQIAVGVWS